jgi:CRP/FNR family transcriptional regulator, cyclic AMP receptor protein
MERTELLRAIPLFESLDADDLQRLASRLEERNLEKNEIVFNAGDEGATLFVIQKGAVEISSGGEGKANVTLATLGPGQFFGELSLLDGAPRSATATATKETLLLALDRDDFVEFIKKDPDAALRILAEVGERIRHTSALLSQIVSRNVIAEEEDKLTLGQRVADRVAAFGGSWPFIGIFGGLMAIWMTINAILGNLSAFDPYPFILLNLMLSTLAALQAPIIMMSQNRQSSKDKALAENDYKVNLKSEMGIDRMIKAQAEMMARLELIERRMSSVVPSSSRT